MGATSIVLKLSDELRPQVEAILSQLFARVAELLPNAECHHIGATSIPGAVTKGDIDILVRVSAGGFESAKEVLGKHFEIKQAKNWTTNFASFGDDSTYAMPVGIQLVVRDSELDFLRYLRDYLIEHPAAAEEYNRIKQANAAFGPERYWQEKDKFFATILAERTKSRGKAGKAGSAASKS